MVSDPSTDHIVRWTDDGNSFLVLDEFSFAKQLLPLYFRHKNFSSFIRQLNFYNFKKRGQAQLCNSEDESKRQVDGKYIRLQHPYFKRNQLHLLQLIKRKSTHDSHNNVKATVASLTAQVKELKGQYDDLFKIQQQILYIFSRYMRANPIPRTLAGGRERLMLGGEEGEGGGSGGLLPHPNVELVEDGDDENDERRVDEDHTQNEEEDQAIEATATALGGMEASGERADVEAFDDAGEGGGFDDEEEGGDDEETKEASEATAQAFAELQNLQDIIDQMPGKQEFLSSIPPFPSPSDRPSKRRARATSSPAAVAPSSPPAALAAPKYEPYVYEPSTPPAAMSTFNAFPITDASVALPPLYPSQSYINQQTAASATSTAAGSAASTASSSVMSRSRPKLLYSQEHYAALTNRDGYPQHHDDDSKHNNTHQQPLPLSEPTLYSNNSFSSWSAPSEHKDNEPLSASLFTPTNARQNSWMPSEIPPGSPQLVNYLNADDSTAESDYGIPLSGGESGEHSVGQTAATSGNGGQYGSWQQYQY